jgi:hypothetical protein
MEKFGWPMGPAYLLDVVGIDTGVHAAKVMAEGFPERMQPNYKSGTEIMFENNRYGQKNGKGYYEYVADKKGKPKKTPVQETYDLIKPVVVGAPRIRRRRNHRALHDSAGQRSGPLPGRKHCSLAGRSRHGPDHGHRFPSVPRRRLPLCGPDGRGQLRGTL